MMSAIRRALGRTDTVRVRNLNGAEAIGRVRVWHCRGDHYEPFAPVPHITNHSTYSVQTVEGWWLNIAQGRVDSWFKRKPGNPPVTATRWGVYPAWRRRRRA